MDHSESSFRMGSGMKGDGSIKNENEASRVEKRDRREDRGWGRRDGVNDLAENVE